MALWKSLAQRTKHLAVMRDSDGESVSHERMRSLIGALRSPDRLRNAQIIAELERASQNALPHLIDSLHESYATWGTQEHTPTLEVDFRLNAIEALGLMRSDEAVGIVSFATKDQMPVIRCYAAEALGRIGDNAACSLLRQMLSDEHLSVKRAVKAAMDNLRHSAPGELNHTERTEPDMEEVDH